MSKKDTKSKTAEVIHPRGNDERFGIVSRLIEPESNRTIEKDGIVTNPIVPEASNPDTIPPPEQPTEQPTPNLNPQPESPKPEQPSADKPTE